VKQTIILILFIPLILFSQNTKVEQTISEQTENLSPIIIINNFSEDERVILTIDSLERADDYLDKLKTKGINAEYRSPRQGTDYLFVYFTIIDKVDLKVGLTEFRLTNTNVICDDNKYYKALTQQYVNLSFSSVNQDKKGFIIFELPIEIRPTELRYFYQYRDDIKPKKKIKLGQINVPLLKTANERK